MDRIEPDALYDERGEVSRTRPLLQGDIFDDVCLPGFGTEPLKVQIIAHPCAMRTGADLTPRITVAPIEPHPPIFGKGWDGHTRVMPLPQLVDGAHYATMFIDVTACPAELLSRDQRIATLSNQGIYLLQQRLIMHYTRTEIGLEVLRSQSAPVLTEAELQWDWLDQVLTEAEVADDAALSSEVAVFEAWIRAGDPCPQVRLRTEIAHTDVRREAQRAAVERAQSRASS